MILAGPALANALWHRAGDDWLSYDTETGETCLLSGLAHFVVEQIGTSGVPMVRDSLIARVHAEEPEFTRADCERAVTEAVRSLKQARLLAVTDATIAVM